MSEYNSYEPFSVCFNLLKLRYRDYDESISSKNFLRETDKVNVFINLESVFKYLSMITDLENKIMMQRDFDELIISNVLNLAAHYKRFFVNNGLDTRVYLYHTDLESEEFTQFRYNEEYRSYYLVKYNDNPKFVLLTDKLKGKILPDVRTYCEFIPGVYYISAKNIEGSLVPYIIAAKEPNRKNFIVGGELYDSLYSFLPNFVNHYIKRSNTTNAVYSSEEGYLLDITKKPKTDVSGSLPYFNTYPYYCTLLSVLGDRTRNIDKISGYGVSTLQRCMDYAWQRNIIQKSSTNPNLLGDMFGDGEIKEEFIQNFYCTSILAMYEELTEAHKMSVLQQLQDRIDINSIQLLNHTTFANHPFLLEGLLI